MSVRGEQMSQPFMSSPWFAALCASLCTAGIHWLRGFARRAKPEDLMSVEGRLGNRIDQVNHDVARKFVEIRGDYQQQQERSERQIGEVHKRLDDLFKSIAGMK